MEKDEKQNYVVSKEIDELALSLINESDDFCQKFTFPKTPKGKDIELDFLDDIAEMGMAVDIEEQQELISKYKKYYRG